MDDPSRYGPLALALSIGGVLVAVLLELTIGRAQPGAAGGLLIFIGFQVGAFILGFGARKDNAGKAACITSVVLACGSFLLVS